MSAKFDLLKRLGSGHFGEVWKAMDLALNAEVALKIIPLSKIPNPKNFFQEAQMLKAAEHDNVVSVKEADFFNSDSIYVAMEFL